MAAKALERRLRLSPEQARTAIRVVEASGERVWWRGKKNEAGSGGAESARPGAQVPRTNPAAEANNAALSVQSRRTTSDGKLVAPDVDFTFDGKYLTRDEKTYKNFGRNERGANTTQGNIVINSNLLRNVDGRMMPDNDQVVPTLRHEAFHRWLTPGAGKATADLKPFTAFARDLRWRLYFDNQAGQYLEEALAEAYARKSLKEGFRYPLEQDYGLTKRGIATDAARLGLGLGAGLTATEVARYGLGYAVDRYYNYLDSLGALPSGADRRRPAQGIREGGKASPLEGKGR